MSPKCESRSAKCGAKARSKNKAGPTAFVMSNLNTLASYFVLRPSHFDLALPVSYCLSEPLCLCGLLVTDLREELTFRR